jgi:hypothetical protein
LLFLKGIKDNQFLVSLVKDSKEELEVSFAKQSNYNTQNNEPSNLKKRVVKLRG